ncbi:MAG: phosphomannomutase [Armatimonadetes bacterium]|nr:phosphomannomutase [Armatimonadota bacterium]
MGKSKLLPWLKAYDVRGEVPTDWDVGEAYRIGLAYAEVVRPQGPVAVGYDIRLSSPSIARAVVSGLNAGGVDTREMGLCGTEFAYFACAQPGLGGAIMVTASHNPKNDNGMKLVAWDERRHAVKALTREAGLLAIEEKVRLRKLKTAVHPGRSQCWNAVPSYLSKLLDFVRGVDLEAFEREHGRRLKIVANAGNGGAGLIINELEPHLPFEFVKVFFEPDGNFPNDVPNPLKNQKSNAATRQAILDSGADFGVAWDGDYDRCFFFDETGEFIDGYYVVGLLATQLLKLYPGAKIIHDPRLIWNTQEMVEAAGGQAVRSRTGHARIKELMVAEDVLYGGEMSAHHYFRDFGYCDSGMVPWLLVASLLATSGVKLSERVRASVAKYPCSGERSFAVNDAERAFAMVIEHLDVAEADVDRFDGISLTFDAWRMNLRESDTEAGQMRLNIESRGDTQLPMDKATELLELLAPVRV